MIEVINKLRRIVYANFEWKFRKIVRASLLDKYLL